MSKQFKLKFAAVFGVAVLAAACAAWAATEAPKPAEENKVLARVEGREITEADVNAVLQSMGPQGMMMYGNPQGRQLILDEIVSMYLFSLEAEKEKLDGEQDFIDFMARVRTQSLAQRAMRNAVKDVQATEEEAQKFYDEHKDQFTQPERIHARHILISDDATSADTIAKVQADLKAGASFDEEAKKLSTCPSAPQGGDLGEFTKEQMVPEFSDAAFALKEPGDISEPVKSPFGWHIIRLEGRTPAQLTPFDDVKAQILQGLNGQKQQERIKAKVEELKKAYKVEMLAPVSDDAAAEAASDDAKK